MPIPVHSKEERYLKRSASRVFATACQISFLAHLGILGEQGQMGAAQSKKTQTIFSRPVVPLASHWVAITFSNELEHTLAGVIIYRAHRPAKPYPRQTTMQCIRMQHLICREPLLLSVVAMS